MSLSEIDEVLQDLKADDDKPQPGPLGDIQKLDSMLNDRYNKIYYAVTNMYMLRTRCNVYLRTDIVICIVNFRQFRMEQ